ncbi:MAG: hypothetical protein PHF86_08530 [Candidatus Nanoarchaeia archaeon]|jgi:hypothetical protein|nr:hypothetical protein [Candidatus Nanoarchaeia archaeon]
MIYIKINYCNECPYYSKWISNIYNSDLNHYSYCTRWKFFIEENYFYNNIIIPKECQFNNKEKGD